MIFYRFADLKAAGYVKNWTTLYRWIEAGIFPPGTKIAPNTRVWTAEELDAYRAKITKQDAA